MPSSSPAPTRGKNIAPEQVRATVITPVVSQITEQLFNNPFRVVGEPQEAEEVAEAIADVKEHNEDPTSIIWGEPSTSHQHYYQSVIVDDVKYEVSILEPVASLFPEQPTRSVML